MGAVLVSESQGLSVDRPVYSFKVTGLLLLSKGSTITADLVGRLKEHGVHVVCVNASGDTLDTRESILDVLNPVCYGIVDIDTVYNFCNLILQTEGLLPILNKINNHDCITLSHSLSVGLFMYDYYRKQGVSGDKMGLTGCLHDVGKLYIPSEILGKPRKLSKNEYEFVKLHPSAGYALLAEDKTLSELVNLDIVLYHHERKNGKGYPYGKIITTKDQSVTPLQMFDVFEALTSSRSYRVSASKDKALQIITEGSGVEFSRGIANTVIKYLTEGGVVECTVQKPQVI